MLRLDDEVEQNQEALCARLKSEVFGGRDEVSRLKKDLARRSDYLVGHLLLTGQILEEQQGILLLESPALLQEVLDDLQNSMLRDCLSEIGIRVLLETADVTHESQQSALVAQATLLVTQKQPHHVVQLRRSDLVHDLGGTHFSYLEQNCRDVIHHISSFSLLLGTS